MEPFAYQQPKRTNGRKLVGIALVVTGLTAWYLDLVPEFAPVSTGSLHPSGDVTDPDFIAMLTDTSAENSDTSDSGSASTGDFLSDSTAEFDEDVGLPSFDEILDQAPPVPGTAMEPSFGSPPPGNYADGTSAASNIQQASFEAPAGRPQAMDPVLSADVAVKLRQIDAWIEAGETLEAHAALSRLYWKQPEVRSYLYDRLDVTAAEIYANPARHFAEPYVVQFGDALEVIGEKHSVPWQYLARLNRVTPETLQAGQEIKVLKGPFGAVVELDSMRLTLHAHGWYVRSYPIGIGQDRPTPMGEFQVEEKRENPVWHRPDGGMVSGDDPANPLGDYWLGIGGGSGIHGTNDPNAIGAHVAGGCIHVADGDIAEIYQLLGSGSPVVIR